VLLPGDQAFDQIVVFDIEADDRVKLRPLIREQTVEVLRLARRAGVAVEQEAIGTLGGFEPPVDRCICGVVVDVTPAGDGVSQASRHRGLVAHRSSEQVAGRQ